MSILFYKLKIHDIVTSKTNAALFEIYMKKSYFLILEQFKIQFIFGL